jgi:hypothetical protein
MGAHEPKRKKNESVIKEGVKAHPSITITAGYYYQLLPKSATK